MTDIRNFTHAVLDDEDEIVALFHEEKDAKLYILKFEDELELRLTEVFFDFDVDCRVSF